MNLEIHSQHSDYTVSFSENFSFLKELEAYHPRMIVMDRKVHELYHLRFEPYIKPDEILLIDALEVNKNIQTALELCDELLKSSAKRNLNLISVGGGITHDITGFVASILYRGIDWFLIPTTLLAQSDSCLGGKTALNHQSYKNILGSFYPPKKVFLDVGFTQSLSEYDFCSGMGEIVKQQLMSTKPLRDIIQDLPELSVLRHDLATLQSLVKQSLEIKYSFIRDDEFDHGKRNLLNYGHCLGHALETTSDYQIPHGIAVLVGMAFANHIAVQRDLMSAAQADEIWHHMIKPYVPLAIDASFLAYEPLLAAMKMDKKRVNEGLPLIVRLESGELTKLSDLTATELAQGIVALKQQLLKS